MRTPEEFLEANGFASRNLDRAALVAAFTKEMDAGLAGKESSLKMIPSYISPDGTISRGKSAIVLDAGGTNFRAAAVSIGADGSASIEHKTHGPMPGATTEVSAEEFYARLAEEVTRVEPFADMRKVGFCFSYAAEVSPELDARLIAWTKEVKAPEVVGQWVGSELAKRLGENPPKIAVLNDTVATLLAGKTTEAAENRCSGYVGFILGTGTNTAYAEKRSNIVKIGGGDERTMAVNAESGAFARIEQSTFDAALDARTADPGHYRFEKMIAGAYLGRLGHEVLRAAAREGFFEKATATRLAAMPPLESIDLDNFCANVNSQRPNPLDKVFTSEAERATARRLAMPVFERAAILTAIHLAAFVIKTGGGTDPSSPVCVAIDGSTYYKTKTVDFPKTVKAELDQMLGRRHVAFKLVQVDDAPMIGAAVAALLNG